ncbi:ATP-dependent endonuclease [Flavobacterium sp. Root901]|uniref:ATP-dependent nuclease n=1 Tax=Flavobacterium sp. Root901 TaxID=1736605 RepID=UPI00070D33CF|nr:AAA family ATPase [Flavobacterium sp. Root901]KRD09129.1 ATP-dependent endonuclease [Flavobacterium sp. Root901]
MKISTLKIKGFRSFGPNEVLIPIEDNLVGLIGLNSAGKTTCLEALKKMFGQTSADRELFRQDFHVGKDEDPDFAEEKHISIEAVIDFSEEEKQAIPHFFSEMVVDEQDGDPYLRIRLEAYWKKSNFIPDGEIDSKTYFIKTAQGFQETEDSKKLFPSHFRSLIQLLYVPAIRRPSEQLRYSSGTILFRVLKKIKWGEAFKGDFDKKVTELNNLFNSLDEFGTVQQSITELWQQFHKDERYKDTALGFGGSDLDSILKKIEISFSPTGTYRSYKIDELGEGYRSLFYLTLVCALLDIEEKLSEQEDQENIGINRPLLTILAVEEPENHIAPQLLGRVIKILKKISCNDSSQVLMSSHTPAIVKRLKHECILHFRINHKYETQVSRILLPERKDDAYKYIKEAVHNYPEIYFAKLVVIGEGDSEEVIFNRLMEVMNIDFDDNIITFAPLGHRFVSHIWKLLEALHIPYVTLLDLDIERDGGGWGRVKYALKQLIEVGADRDILLKLKGGGVLPDSSLELMHKKTLKTDKDLKSLGSWVRTLKRYRVFYSAPLDLDFLMLTHYPEFYKRAVPENGGPQIPDKQTEEEKFAKKVSLAVQAVLKSEKAIGYNYSEEEKQLMIWYNYHFLGRGKPVTHIQVLSSMKPREIRGNLPPVFREFFTRIKEILDKQ